MQLPAHAENMLWLLIIFLHNVSQNYVKEPFTVILTAEVAAKTENTTLPAVSPELWQYYFILQPMFVSEHHKAARRKCPWTNEIRFICSCLAYLGLGWGCGMRTFYL
jgi:hypothetical protein